jgi:proteasome assembly chaperone (PAC2) family protein
MIVAFEGWNDAGDAATTAVAQLEKLWGARPIATIDPEEFYDFTTVRPSVSLDANGRREIHWPTNQLSIATPPNAPEMILFRGVEPQLKWRTFSEEIISIAVELRVRLVMTLGALLADVAHSRPTQVYGTAYEQTVIDALHLEPSRYEGPTGIVGVLHGECAMHGVNTASLWAAVPSYVPSAPSPKAALALVERVCAMLGTTADTAAMVVEAMDYERQISELVSEDDETVAYVRHLEEAHDRDEIAVNTADHLVEEVERFLREN